MEKVKTFSIRESSGRVHELALPQNNSSLAAAIWLSGDLPAPPLCSGLGRCGSCRVRFLSTPPPATDVERQTLSEEDVTRGFRLACRHRPAAGMELELPPPADGAKKGSAGGCSKLLVPPRKAEGALYLAVDLGTTSIGWRLLEKNGQTVQALEEGQLLNPQMGAGSDVISRLAVARSTFSESQSGRTRLAELARRALRRLTRQCAQRWGREVHEIGVAGNTAMTAILLDLDISGLAAAPYRLPAELEHHEGKAGLEVRLPDLPPIWLPPQPAPFVGGDISAGAAFLIWGRVRSSEASPPSFPFLLADLGTNGEFVLAVDARRSWIASVPMGPALEGIGLSRGGLAEPGCVHRFSLGPAGLHAHILPAESGRPAQGPAMLEENQAKSEAAKERRLCGTGYLSLVDCLLRAGVLTASGQLCQTPASPLAGRILRHLERRPSGWRLHLPQAGDPSLFVSGEDVEAILKVKAAFSLALERLLRHSGLSSADLSAVFLAGALGRHAPVDALERLGFLSPGLGGRTRSLGNTSLEGAELCLTHPEIREPLARWSRDCQVVELVGDAAFMADYAAHMRFGAE